MKVSELMASDLETLGRGDSMARAYELMEDRPIRHLLIVEDGKLLGVLSQRDLLRASPSSTDVSDVDARRAFLENVSVTDVMTGDVITISPDDDIKDAALTMLSSSIGCLPVVKSGELVGLITDADILRHVAGV